MENRFSEIEKAQKNIWKTKRISRIICNQFMINQSCSLLSYIFYCSIKTTVDMGRINVGYGCLHKTMWVLQNMPYGGVWIRGGNDKGESKRAKS